MSGVYSLSKTYETLPPCGTELRAIVIVEYVSAEPPPASPPLSLAPALCGRASLEAGQLRCHSDHFRHFYSEKTDYIFLLRAIEEYSTHKMEAVTSESATPNEQRIARIETDVGQTSCSKCSVGVTAGATSAYKC